MYDTILMALTQEQAGGADMIAAANSLERAIEHKPVGGGIVSYTGFLGNLKIWLDAYNFKIISGSLCKWFLDENYQTMSRGDVERAIERLSDLLHLPMKEATVTRADFGRVFIMQHPTAVYFNYLGMLSRYHRLEEPSGLYYTQRDERLCFYDKNREQRDKGSTPPALYCDKNVLRYEQRYLRRLHNRWGEVTAARLYDENFYISLYNRWVNSYRSIDKLNNIQINFENMKGVKDMDKRCRLLFIERAGGLPNALAIIDADRAAGKITSKQAFEMKKALKEACKYSGGIAEENEAIAELDTKMNEAARFYR